MLVAQDIIKEHTQRAIECPSLDEDFKSFGHISKTPLAALKRKEILRKIDYRRVRYTAVLLNEFDSEFPRITRFMVKAPSKMVIGYKICSCLMVLIGFMPLYFLTSN